MPLPPRRLLRASCPPGRAGSLSGQAVWKLLGPEHCPQLAWRSLTGHSGLIQRTPRDAGTLYYHMQRARLRSNKEHRTNRDTNGAGDMHKTQNRSLGGRNHHSSNRNRRRVPWRTVKGSLEWVGREGRRVPGCAEKSQRLPQDEVDQEVGIQSEQVEERNNHHRNNIVQQGKCS